MTVIDLTGELQLADWRRRVSELYADVRAAPTPAAGHALWSERRDRLFSEHPQSPLAADDVLRRTGIPYWPYNPDLRFELPLADTGESSQIEISTGAVETTTLRRIGMLALPAPLDTSIDVWWLEQYGGGLFVPVRDATAGDSTYGGGRYLLDTAKGADLGMDAGLVIVDLNFLYHPSCRYDDAWQCPLAPPGNVIAAAVEAGEML